jgi:antitoxin ParD1/3/4
MLAEEFADEHPNISRSPSAHPRACGARRHDNPTAVVDEAIRVLVERDQYARLKAAIAVGMEQVARGETIPWTPDYFDRLKRESEALARSGKPIKDEVKP